MLTPTPSVRWILTGIAALFVLCICRLMLAQSADAPEIPALRQVADLPLPGPAVRFDYQSFDAEHGRLYIAHMNANQLVVFDVRARKVVANLDGFARVHGVLAVPQIDRVYASATGSHQVNVVSMPTFKTLAAVGPVDYPDGLAYAPGAHRVFVSDEHGGVDAVVDAQTNQLITRIPLGGGAGNTVYDSSSGSILVAVHKLNQLAVIDPVGMKVTERYPLAGVDDPHGIALDLANRLAFIAGEENHTLAVFDLRAKKLLAVYPVGDDPDVLAFDPGLMRLYVSAESGVVTVFKESDRKLTQIAQFEMPHAHSVAVDRRTHLVYFPLENIDGRPLLRIMEPIVEPAARH
jgi:DNA-binding beta-propeller fold protein YncE